MKRVFLFSLAVMMLLTASYAFAVQQDFPGMLGEVTIGVNVPSNWDAVKDTTANTANDANVPCVKLTDKSDANKWFWIFLADKEDAGGHALTLRQVGNNMLAAYRDRGSEKIEDTNGYYVFEFYSSTGVAYRYVFMDSDYDNRIKSGRYLTYQYSYDTLEPTEVNAITLSVTLDGVASGTSGQNGGQSGGRTDTGETTNQSVGGGGGSGGCSTGLGSLSLLAALTAFLARKSK